MGVVIKMRRGGELTAQTLSHKPPPPTIIKALVTPSLRQCCDLGATKESKTIAITSYMAKAQEQNPVANIF